MANYITTLQDKDGSNGMLPRTVLEAIADGNGNYLDNQLTASDVNALKNGKIASMDSAITSLTMPTALTMEGVTYESSVSDITGGYAVVNGLMIIKIRCIISSTTRANYFHFPITQATSIAVPVLFINWSQDSAPLHGAYKGNGDLQLTPSVSGSVYTISAVFSLL